MEQEINEKIDKLKDKYASMGQNLSSYLDGLLYSEYLTYWDYIHLDVLLNLQNPKTNFPDENIFILYHQITELYFKLSRLAIEEIANQENINTNFFILRMKRINSYFENLIRSFEIMVDGMEPDQFFKFRMALLPASGFQSAQFRMIEICSTTLKNLMSYDNRKKLKEEDIIEKNFQYIYWRQGATELASGKKTLTLIQFEKKYSSQLIELAKEYQHKNIRERYLNLSEVERNNDELKNELRKMDLQVNVQWSLVHYKSAVRYLDRKPEAIAATGGTNWQKFLPPKNQKIIFFPEVWSNEEIENWGKSS